MKLWEGRLIIQRWKVVIIPLSPAAHGHTAILSAQREAQVKSGPNTIKENGPTKGGGGWRTCTYLFLSYSVSSWSGYFFFRLLSGLKAAPPPSRLDRFKRHAFWSFFFAFCLFLSLSCLFQVVNLSLNLSTAYTGHVWGEPSSVLLRRLTERSLTPDIFPGPIDFAHSVLL